MKVFGFAGYSGRGKTTLIERVLPQLIAHGLRVSVIKHTHHDFDLGAIPYFDFNDIEHITELIMKETLC